MKDLIFKLCRWALALVSVGGLSACDIIGVRVEYGVPHCDFEAKGRVVDEETSAPVKGVKLTPGFRYTYTDEDGVKKEAFYQLMEGADITDGTFDFNGARYAGDGEWRELHLQLTDPDPETDGHYKDSIYVIPMEYVEGSAEGHWHDGVYTASDIRIEAERIK